MLDLGPLVFTAPWMLAALATLPILWWLLRVTPPAPLVRAFPPLRFLLTLQPQEETPARTPLWLILLRMLIAALIILGLAHPVWDQGKKLYGSGPLILVIDDSWAAAPTWQKRLDTLETLVDQADREGRAVRILMTAKRLRSESQISDLMRPAEARQILRRIEPKPWLTDRRAALNSLKDLNVSGSAHIAWLSDGIDDAGAASLMDRLRELGALRLYREPPNALAKILTRPRTVTGGLAFPVQRVKGPLGKSEVQVRLFDEDGRLLGREKATFDQGKSVTEARFRLPPDIRNRAASAEIEAEDSAGAVFLMDERWRRRPVGIAVGGLTEGSVPLLSDDYYLKRALDPFSDVKTGTIGELTKQKLAMIVLADIGKLSKPQTETLVTWLNKGGVLIRFAGPRMAQGTDQLVPVQLRGGGRALGGTMSWTTPAKLMPFEDKSPFSGLPIPPDIRIKRQVLAQPTLDLNAKTWSRLTDGTPLVTAERKGNGWLILVHTTANTEWSNLPISGLFVGMMQRVAALSLGVSGDGGTTTYPPLQIMDGFGVLEAPSSSAIAIPGKVFSKATAGPKTPPGYYGKGETRRALNLATSIRTFSALNDIPTGVETADYTISTGLDAKPWLLLAALLLLMADLIISYILRGLGVNILSAPTRNVAGRAAGFVFLLAASLTIFATATIAQTTKPSKPSTSLDPAERFALRATSETRLAFVLTKDTAIDSVSRAGLIGLTDILRRRTAVEAGTPIGVDIERDELAFFPLLYWPISLRQRPLSDQAVEKLNAYLRTGGTVLFDTREQSKLTFDPFGSGGAEAAKLRSMLRELDNPALIPVPTDHVMNKAFYLLKDYPGRWRGGTVWVERRGGRHNDGVSSVLIGSNDWAGAWAIDAQGSPMFPVSPDGERQREFAYRFGVNWVMYALTGNYKTDQVHVPSIIERLGQ
ncbi:MAG: DUF4159 domain-containing protein [Alphaproteobacteria bacterium]|nr:DUF4159 domain-containing protein [Alphaproteobacteria bacterium]